MKTITQQELSQKLRTVTDQVLTTCVSIANEYGRELLLKSDIPGMQASTEVARRLGLIQSKLAQTYDYVDEQLKKQEEAAMASQALYNEMASNMTNSHKDEYCTNGCGQFKNHPPTGVCPLDIPDRKKNN